MTNLRCQMYESRAAGPETNRPAPSRHRALAIGCGGAVQPTQLTNVQCTYSRAVDQRLGDIHRQSEPARSLSASCQPLPPMIRLPPEAFSPISRAAVRLAPALSTCVGAIFCETPNTPLAEHKYRTTSYLSVAVCFASHSGFAFWGRGEGFRRRGCSPHPCRQLPVRITRYSVSVRSVFPFLRGLPADAPTLTTVGAFSFCVSRLSGHGQLPAVVR